MTVLDLIDGRIAELDRLTAEAALDGGEPVGDGQELSLLLVALRALRQHKVAGASPLPRAIDRRGAAPTEWCRARRLLSEDFISAGPCVAVRRRASPG